MTSYIKMKLNMEEGSEITLPIKVGGYGGKDEVSVTSMKEKYPSMSDEEAEVEASLYDIRDAYVAWIPKLDEKVKSGIRQVKVYVPRKGWVTVPVQTVTERKARAHGKTGSKVFSGQNIWFGKKPFKNYERSTVKGMQEEGTGMFKDYTLRRDVRVRTGKMSEFTSDRGGLGYYKNFRPQTIRPHREHNGYIEVEVIDHDRGKPVHSGTTHVVRHWRKIGKTHGEFIRPVKRPNRSRGKGYM